MKKGWQCSILILSGMMLILMGSPDVFAQQAKAEFTLEEIVVTAERRETSAQDTPIAVSAWDADVIDEQVMTGFVDMQMRMPSTYVSSGSVTIRGVGRTSGALGTDPGVGIFKDGFYNQEGLSYLSDLYDVERIENVRGPQSTLYGRATVGGAINIITKKPTKEWSGQVKATFGNFEKRDFHTAFGGPTGIDNLYYRIRLSDIYWGGDEENVLYDDEYQGTRDRWYIDMKLLYEPLDNLSFLLIYNIFDQKDRPGATNIRDEWPMAGVDWPYPGVQWAQENFPGSRYANNFYYWRTDAATYGLPNSNPGLKDPYKSAEDYLGHIGEDKKEGSLTVTWDVGDFTVMYLTSYRDYDWKSLTDFDDGPMPMSYGSKRYKLITATYEWSGELQVMYGADDVPFSVIGGLYYFDRHRRMPGKSMYFGSLYEDPPIGPIYETDNAVHYTDAEIWDVSQAVYAQVDYDFLDKWTATVGLRYAEDKKKGREWMLYQYMPTYVILRVPEGDEQNWAPYLYDGVDDPPANSIKLSTFPEHRGSWDEILYKFGLDFKPVDGSLIYGKYEHGFKPGGFVLGGFRDDTFDAELVDAYEAGWKHQWMNARFSSSIAGYYYDYEELQMTFWDEEQNTSYVTNATTAEIYGVELDFTGYIIENLLASISYSYLSTEFGDYPGQVDTAHQRGTAKVPNPDGDTRRYPNPGAVYPYDEDTNPDGRQAWVQNLEGNTMPYSPENKISINATYTIPTDIGDFSINAIYMWQDEVFTDAFNTFDQVAPAYDRMDGQVMWNSPMYTWRVILWMKNVMDESDIIGQSTGQGSQGYPITATYIPPRTFGIDISYKW